MIKRKNRIHHFVHQYFNSSLPLTVQSFNLLAVTGFVTGIIVAISSVLSDAGIESIIINLLASVLAINLLYFARKTNRYLLCYRITVLFVFMITYPILFFLAGGYRSGMPCFFVFAFIYTSLMLKRWECAVALATEFMLYIGCCLMAYFYPETVTVFPTESGYVVDVITGIFVTGALLLSVTLLYIRMYRIRQIALDELNKKLESSNHALLHYDRMKTDFLETVTHEIKAPLTVIMASVADTLDLLEEKSLDESEIAANQKRIEYMVKQIDDIVLDLVDTAAIENGRLVLNCEYESLSDIIIRQTFSDRTWVEENGNKLVYDIQSELSMVWIDAKRIKQVLANLITNASQHTKNGLITIALKSADGIQTVSVIDTGEGMDEKTANEAMNRYASSKPDQWRRGMGLYICKQIVTAHNGDIWIKGEKGKGTNVSFTLREEAFPSVNQLSYRV